MGRSARGRKEARRRGIKPRERRQTRKGREGGRERERERERDRLEDRRRRLIAPICFCRGPHMTPGRNFQYPLVAARVVGDRRRDC